MTADPLIYLNGAISEAGEARISPFDRGFLWGDGVYEITPCFDGRPYRLRDHLERLYRSLKYIRIEAPFGLDAMEQATLDTVAANRDRLVPGGMYRIGHWVTRGVDAPSMRAREAPSPTVMIFLRAVDTQAIAANQAQGIRLNVTPTRRTPPECVETRAKVTSKMNQILAELDAASHDAQALMLDMHGNVAEHATANFFLARDGMLWTPPERNILEGVTRKVVFELCARLDIPVEERNFTSYDIAQAEEYFITSSAICAMPVREIDSFRPHHPVPGPVTARLIAAFAADTGFAFN